MRPSRYLLLSALVAASAAASASQQQHQVRGRPDHHLAARSPQPLFGLFGGDDDDDDSSASATSPSATGSQTDDGLFPAASSSSAAAVSSSAAAAAAASSSSSAALASASASRAAAESSSIAAAAESSSIAAAAASSAAASISSAAASESAASSRSAAAAASAGRTSTSATAQPTTSAGLTTTLTATVQAAPTAVPPTSSATSESSDSNKSGGASTGLIIGVSVTGGVLVLAAFIFLYFKFGTRRFSNFDDGDADIKWPELKHDPDSNVMQPLPARRTGGAGFDMGDESDNEGHDGNGMREKARDSFGNSTTALAAGGGAVGGYGVGEYVDHGYAAQMDPAVGAGYYGEHMYGGQYGVQQTSPPQGGDGGYADGGNLYGVDPYAHAGMAHPHPQQQSYQNHY
ncbi:uncharacterized protein UHOD_04610 [Ustilago sp. UG-2017b]|nr:uncharacterized protein UHOD_04610 [Ustilago sp. UG-2017b]